MTASGSGSDPPLRRRPALARTYGSAHPTSSRRTSAHQGKRPRDPDDDHRHALPPPPSPPKDLSAIFSRFAPPVVAAGKPRVLLKRSQSSSGGGAVREAPASPTRPHTLALDRSFSQPDLPSSPLPSPAPSPARPSLGASLSFPSLSASPIRASLSACRDPFSREGSPSPVRALTAMGAAAPPALGSAYRPLAFALPAAGVGAGVGLGSVSGPTRTYAGGGRTLRRDAVDDELFAAPSTAPASSSSSSSTTTTLLPSLLPPALSRRTLTAVPRAPPRPAQDLGTLRALWGIDAEETLADSEEADSQDRGSRVVAGGLLRKQGEGKRWMDELGWCLEGLREGDRAAARASAVDLVGKLLSRDWLRRLKSSGQAESVYLAFRLAAAGVGRGEAGQSAGPDRVVDTAFAALVALLVRDQRLAEPLFRLKAADVERESARLPAAAAAAHEGGAADERVGAATAPAPSDGLGGGGWSSSPRKAGAGEVDEQSDLLEMLCELGAREWAREQVGVAHGVQEEAGVTRAKGKKVLRGDARHLQALRDIVTSAELFPHSGNGASPSPVTLRSLVLLATRSIAGFAPRAIFQPQHLLCESGLFGQVACMFLDECSPIRGRLEKYENGLDLLPPTGTGTGTGTTISLATISTYLGIFESTSLATPAAYHVISAPDLVSQFASALDDLTLATFLVALDAPPPPASPVPASASADGEEEQEEADALAVLTAALGVLFGLTTERVWAAALVGGGSGGGGGGGGGGTALVRTLVRVLLACRRIAAMDRDDCDEAAAAAVAAVGRPATDPAAASEGQGEGEVEMARSSEAAGDERAANVHKSAGQAVWDVLSLALGVLANLAESAGGELRVLVRELRLDPSCHGRRQCARVCHCPTLGDDATVDGGPARCAQLAY
ncbi:hypothetical protein JCM3770_006829 [Rhodotorula araucariae]